jgi:hypothetical protein
LGPQTQKLLLPLVFSLRVQYIRLHFRLHFLVYHRVFSAELLPGYGSQLKELKVINSFKKDIIEAHTWHMNNTGNGQIMVNNSISENVFGKRWWGMLVSRGSYKKSVNQDYSILRIFRLLDNIN